MLRQADTEVQKAVISLRVSSPEAYGRLIEYLESERGSALKLLSTVKEYNDFRLYQGVFLTLTGILNILRGADT